MKDIKELIYAAVEENAVKFQEIVNNQLQVRAYDAIESLRPEIGASMFGESSHKKMDDEDKEDMEDEEDEDEEELKGKQHKIDKNKNGKIDAHDFKLLRKEEVEAIDESVFDSKDAAQSVANKLKAKHDDGNYHVKADNGKHRVVHAYYPNSKVKKEIANLTEEVGPSTSRFHVLVHKSSSTNVEKAHHAVSGAGNKNFRPGTGLARMDKPGGSHDPTGGDHHVIHAPDHATHENLRKNLSDYGARATIVDTHTGKREDVHEEAQRLKEMSDDERRTELKRFGKKAAETHGYDHPGDKAVNKASSSAVKSELKAARKVVAGTAKPYRSPANEEVADKVVADKVRTRGSRGSFKFFSKKTLPGSDKSSMNEVAMPKNAADWQALITHQIQTTDHPVATDAQFRATTVGKDASKMASLEPGQDALQYATAQGGTVKLP